MIKRLIKKVTPTRLLQVYHWALAWLAGIVYGHPANKMIVIGVTGTNGKSTTVSFIGQMLEQAGHRVGWTSTASFKIAGKEWLNDTKMTMPGRFALQKMLAEMIEAGCRYAIIETSSQGIDQFRHLGINYDTAIFTNLTPEHIEAHGGFENYKQAKRKLFTKLSGDKRKTIDGQEVDKQIIANLDDEYAGYYLKARADKKLGFSLGLPAGETSAVPVIAEKLKLTSQGYKFMVKGIPMQSQLLGKFNISNLMAAVTVAIAEGIDLLTIREIVAKIKGVPGRLEFINEGQDFQVLVDYAPEPASMEQLYRVIMEIEKNRIIHVLGSCGGGRDIARRPVLGKMAGEKADIVIITNEDPYDDDPQEIIDQVAAGALEAGKEEEKDLFKIIDRQQAIHQAVGMAKKNDLVLITGKGCEQAICVADGKKIDWDDRRIARQAIQKNK